MSGEWKRCITLSSEGRQETSFVLDEALPNVVSVSAHSAEMTPQLTLVTAENNSIYFSEEDGGGIKPIFFRAVVPPGNYTDETIWPALGSSMMCAHAVSGQHHLRPKNRYTFRFLPESRRVCVASDGRAPFSLHLQREVLPVVHLWERPLEKLVDAEVRSLHVTPLCRGAKVYLVHPEHGRHEATVTATPCAFRLRLHFDQHGPSGKPPVQGWSIHPVSAEQPILPETFGFGPTDVTGGTCLSVQALSSPSRRPDGDLLCVSCHGPHGCQEGNLVHIHWTQDEVDAEVHEVLTENHLVLRVATGRAPPEDAVYRRVWRRGSEAVPCLYMSPLPADFLRNHRAVYFSLTVGQTECTGLTLALPGGNDRHLFARAQLRKRPTSYVTRAQGSLLGTCRFSTPLERVSRLQVRVLDEMGMPLTHCVWTLNLELGGRS